MKACAAHVCASAALPCNSDHKIIDRKCDVAKETASLWLQQRLLLPRSVLCSLHIASTSFTCGSFLWHDHNFLSREEEVLMLSAAETHVPTVFGASKLFNPFCESAAIWWEHRATPPPSCWTPNHSCGASDYCNAIAKAERRVMKKNMTPATSHSNMWVCRRRSCCCFTNCSLRC